MWFLVGVVIVLAVAAVVSYAIGYFGEILRVRRVRKSFSYKPLDGPLDTPSEYR